MKVIDLLNKIANGEEVPRYIRFDTEMYSLNPNNHYVRECGDFIQRLDIEYNLVGCLNDEVEIIGEPKHIEEIVLNSEEDIIYYENGEKHRFNTNKQNKYFAHKINELTKAVNYLLDKEEK